MPRKRTSKITRLKNRLDKYWRTVGKENAFCEICATVMPEERVNYNRLDPHHIVGRSHAATRYDLANRLWVCSTHHTLGKMTVQHNEEGWFWSKDSDDDWLSMHKPGLKEYLGKKKREIKKWKIGELEELIEQYKRMESDDTPR